MIHRLIAGELLKLQSKRHAVIILRIASDNGAVLYLGRLAQQMM